MMKPRVLLAALALCSAAAFALPTTQDVQGAVNAGDYPRAEQMMQEVVAARPQSAKAHYVYAEILAREAKFDEAARQAQQAQQIDPSLGFTDPQRFRNFQQLLQREQRGGSTAPRVADRTAVAPTQVPHASSGVPGWVWGAGIALVAFLIWRAVSRRALARAVPAPAYGGGYGPGPGYGAPGAGYGGYPPGASPGGSALRTGLAAAGGLAGGMLLEKYLEGQHGESWGNNAPPTGWVDDGSGQAAQELEQRPIDFGQGNDWGGGDVGGADDFTPSGDNNGGW